jgi:ribonucleoside-diphosphate reductase alpha chain
MYNLVDGTISSRLSELREVAVIWNKKVAGILGIGESTAITCVKPEGTTSQLCDRASGIHPRYSPFYIRTVRADKKDPLCKMMVDMGFPCEDDVTKPNDIKVFSFPIKSPTSSLMRDDMSAIDQLKLWLVYKKYWAEHTVSITVYVREHEWVSVAAFVYENFDDISGISFLPHTDHIYKQAPYQEITEQEYNEWVARMPKDVDWLKIADYEKDDETTGMQELACVGGQCELK